MMRKYKKVLIIVIPALLAVMLDLVWLSVFIVLVALIYCVVLRFISLIPFRFLRKAVKGIFLFLFLLATAISIKLLVFDIYKIPSSSMENMLYPDDVVIVNKLTYGPKLPSSPFEIPWVNLAFYLNQEARSRIKETWWDYIRLRGITPIKQGDVFVFSLDQSRDYFVVKRCVGLPGDVLRIRDGEIYSNNKLLMTPGTVKNNCQFKVKNRKQLYKLKDSLAICGLIKRDCRSRDFWNATFSKAEFSLLKAANCIDSIKKNKDSLNIPNAELIRTTHSKWTLDDMGPIIIPKKNIQITLNPDTFMLYGKIMKLFEKRIIVEKNGAYFLNGKRVATYTFKLNYYFMMGDNREETMDSRFWGFLPETNVVGKVQGVLFSNKNDKFQWDRLFKLL